MPLVVVLAAVIYAYFLFLGWGLTRMVLPRVLSVYRTWFAPWIGLMMAAVLLTWLSRLGMGTAIAFYLVTIAGSLFAALSVWRSHDPLPARRSFGLAFPVAFLLVLSMALYVLLSLSSEPTTVSLGNNDPACYSAMGDFLKTGTISHAPSRDLQRPMMYWLGLVMSQRPGTYLLISACAQLFRTPTYRIFSVLIAVMFAATAPLVGILVEAVGGGPLAVLLALALSVFNVNQFYELFHGFAGQIFFQGCLIIALSLIWQGEEDREHWSSYALVLGLAICAMVGIFAEGMPLLIVPYGLYAAFQLVVAKEPKWHLAQRYALPLEIAVALDPLAFWNFLRALLRARGTSAGWDLPRWAMPADIVGFVNCYNSDNQHSSVLLAAVTSIPVAYFAVSGWRGWRRPRLTLSVISVPIAILMYAYAIRHYSYGYHKIATICSFLLVSAFAMGVARAAQEYPGHSAGFFRSALAVTLAGTLCLMALMPLVRQMKTSGKIVRPDLVELQSIRHLVGTHPIYLADHRVWYQLWAAEFLDPVPVLLDSPNYFSIPRIRLPDELILLPGSAIVSRSLLDEWVGAGMTIWWHNKSYLLIGPAGGPG